VYEKETDLDMAGKLLAERAMGKEGGYEEGWLQTAEL